MKRYFLDQPEAACIHGYGDFIVLPDGKIRKISSVMYFPKYSEHPLEIAYISYLDTLGITADIAQKEDFRTLDVHNMSTEEKHDIYIVPRNFDSSNGFYYDVCEKNILLFASKKSVIKFWIDHNGDLRVGTGQYDNDIFNNVIGLDTTVALKCINRIDKFKEEGLPENRIELDDIFSIAEHIYQK